MAKADPKRAEETFILPLFLFVFIAFLFLAFVPSRSPLLLFPLFCHLFSSEQSLKI